jgi:hypothetical protein
VSFACTEWGCAGWRRWRLLERKKSGSSRRTKCGSGGDGGHDLWESGEEDGRNNREEICGIFACSFGLLRWRANVFAIGVLEEIGRASA